jgi:hypothetical protein
MIRAAYFTTRLLGGESLGSLVRSSLPPSLSLLSLSAAAVKHECFIKFLIKPMHTHT